MRDLSRINSKNYEITTRDGHVKGLLVNLKISNLNSLDPLQVADLNKMSVYGAPNSWKMRNSFRKFHAYRNLMFEHSGITDDEKGRYGKTMRPYLDASHVNATDLVPFTLKSDNTAIEYDKGDWTYSELATVPLYDAETVKMEDSTLSVADAWPIHICETFVADQVEGETSGTYKSVGMIHAYNLDRQDVVTPAADNVVEGPQNPLAALIASGNQATGAILTIAEDQELEKPPYDTNDDGDSCATALQAYKLSRTTGGVVSMDMFLPAGILRFLTSQVADIAIEVTVLGSVLCKDMA